MGGQRRDSLGRCLGLVVHVNGWPWWKILLVVPAILEGLAKLVRAFGDYRRRRSLRPKPGNPEPPADAEPTDPSAPDDGSGPRPKP